MFRNFFFWINTITLFYIYQIFLCLQGHLHFFWHFSFTITDNLFKKHPLHMQMALCPSFPIFFAMPLASFVVICNFLLQIPKIKQNPTYGSIQQNGQKSNSTNKWTNVAWSNQSNCLFIISCQKAEKAFPHMSIIVFFHLAHERVCLFYFPVWTYLSRLI